MTPALKAEELAAIERLFSCGSDDRADFFRAGRALLNEVHRLKELLCQKS